ncbi:MAG: hypothetical protein ACYCX0_11590 [Desulfurivibrionaceae bacterium]
MLKYNFLYYTAPSLRAVAPLAQFSAFSPEKLSPHAGTKKQPHIIWRNNCIKQKTTPFPPISVKKFVLLSSFASFFVPTASPMNPAKTNKKQKNETVARLLL